MLALTSCLLKIKFDSDYSIIIDLTLLVVAFSIFITEPMRGREEMRKMTKRGLLKLMADAGKKAALIGYGSASLLGYHQPKEPVNLKEKLEKK